MWALEEYDEKKRQPKKEKINTMMNLRHTIRILEPKYKKDFEFVNKFWW